MEDPQQGVLQQRETLARAAESMVPDNLPQPGLVWDYFQLGRGCQITLVQPALG